MTRQKSRTKHVRIPLKTRVAALEDQIDYGRKHGFSKSLMKKYRTELKSLKIEFKREREKRRIRMREARKARLKNN